MTFALTQITAASDAASSWLCGIFAPADTVRNLSTQGTLPPNRATVNEPFKMTRAADKQLPVFDRSGEGPLSNPDNDPSGIVGGATHSTPTDHLDENLAEAENSRPDLPDETVDGLDDTEEEIRRQAEDLPLDTPGSL
jgi:hypothetical protein